VALKTTGAQSGTSSAPHEMVHATLAIGGMTCASCVRRVEKGLLKVPGVVEAAVNLATERASVTCDPTIATVERLVDKVKATGYDATPITERTPSTPPAPPAPQAPPEQTAELDVAGMTCASCVRRVERALSRTDGVAAAGVNLATERAAVTYDPRVVTPTDLIAAVERAGYGASQIAQVPSAAAAALPGGGTGAIAVAQVQAFEEMEDETARRREREIARRRDTLLVGIALSAPVVLLSMFFMNRFPGENWLLLAFTAPVWATSAPTSTARPSACCATSGRTWTCWSASARRPPFS
jgi:Cu+-exporting ATPase